MSKAPSMPIFIDAYLADTSHLETVEHGAYLLLLMAMWRRNGWVPDDDKDNARIVGLSKAKWVNMKKRLSPFLTFENGEITQLRLLSEWINVQNYLENQSKKGKISAQKRREKLISESKENKDLPPTAVVSRLQPESNTHPNPIKESPNPLEGELFSPVEVKPNLEVEFDNNFWPEYPHKVGKVVALKAFIKAREKTPLNEILDGLERYKKTKPAERSWLNPSTFLRQLRWLDEPAKLPDGHFVVKNIGTDGWVVTCGSDEYAAWKRHYQKANSSEVYKFKDEPGLAVNVPSRWPKSGY